MPSGIFSDPEVLLPLAEMIYKNQYILKARFGNRWPPVIAPFDGKGSFESLEEVAERIKEIDLSTQVEIYVKVGDYILYRTHYIPDRDVDWDWIDNFFERRGF